VLEATELLLVVRSISALEVGADFRFRFSCLLVVRARASAGVLESVVSSVEQGSG
jgi:hypothetical protein